MNTETVNKYDAGSAYQAAAADGCVWNLLSLQPKCNGHLQNFHRVHTLVILEGLCKTGLFAQARKTS